LGAARSLRVILRAAIWAPNGGLAVGCSIVKSVSIVACWELLALSGFAASDKPLLPTPITPFWNETVQEIELADFDGDGRPDIVARGTNSIAVALDAPSSTFGAPVVYAQPTDPRGLAIADFDLDGNLDIASADRNIGTLVMRWNDGAGAFPSFTSTPTVGSASDVAAADFDKDGRLDLIVGSNGLASFALHLAGPGGALGSATAFPTFMNFGQVTFADDFDGDGNSDACFVSYLGAFTMLGDGAGGFMGLARTALTQVNPLLSEVADFDGDSLPDLVFAPFDSPFTTKIHYGTSSGAFSNAINVQLPEPSAGIRAHDLNSDGRPDLVIRSITTSDVFVLQQSSSGGFPSVTRHGTGGAIQAQAAFDLADLDGDTRLDYVAFEPGGRLVTLRGTSVGTLDGLATFMPKNGTANPGTAIPSPTDVAAFDADLDGIADTAFSFANGAGFTRTVMGSSGVAFAPHVQFQFSGPIGPTPALAIGDLNNDADLDIVALNGPEGSMTLRSMNGSTGAAFGAPITSTVIITSPGNPGTDVVLGDFTNDGRLDAVVARSGPMTLLLGLGNGSFGFPTPLTLDASSHRVAFGDFNLDGDLDVAGTGGSGIDVALGNGLGAFLGAPGATPLSADVFGELTVVDIDENGSLELVYGATTGVVTVQMAGGLVGSISTFNVGSFVRDVAVDDLDGDGDLDFAAHSDGGVVVGLRNSQGATSLFGPFAASLQIAAIAIDLGDYSGDGLPDVVTASSQDTIGAIRVMPSSPPATAITQSYGAGKPGSNGVPILASLGPPKLGAASGISITNGLAGAPSLLFVGVLQAAIPFDLGTLLVQPLVALSLPSFDGNGDLSLPYVISNDAALCGVELRFQAMFVDPAAPGPLHTAQTNGLRWVFGA
jgi:FG-GAP-like repeat